MQMPIHFLPLSEHETHIQIRMIPHNMCADMLIERLFMAAHGLEIKRPQHLGQEEPVLRPRDLAPGTLAHAEAEGEEGPQVVVGEAGVVERVVVREPALRAELGRVGEVPLVKGLDSTMTPLGT